MDAKSLFSVKGKTVLITGGGSGIGRMFTEGYVAGGADVIISSRNSADLKKTCEEMTAMGPGTCRAISVNLATVAGVEALAENLRKELNVTKLHVLVNNSGTTWGEPLEKFQEKGWDRVMDLNVKSLFFLTKALLPLLKAGGSKADPARVINVGSVAGIKPQAMPTYSYDVSKVAVHYITKKLASDLAKDNITVNAIAPGFVPSKMSKQLTAYNTEERLREMVPLGRMGEPADMAGAAIYLSSRASSWTTGQILVVDGGFTSDVRSKL